MGCDIHAFAEKKNSDGKWEIVLGENCYKSFYECLLENEISKGDIKDERKEYLQKCIKEYSKPSMDCVYNDRNYNLFALLADVRNHNGIKPIDNPRGIPEDVCPEIKEELEIWEYDGHSRSYFSLHELIEFSNDNSKSIYTDSGYVNKKEYIEYLKDGKPSSWCGGIGGYSIERVSCDIMDKIIAGKYENYDKDKKYYTYISWDNNLIETTGLNKIIDRLKAFGANNDNDVRIVFWFDN